jgi:RNA polymerase sigma factor (TIGR02999 family)
MAEIDRDQMMGCLFSEWTESRSQSPPELFELIYDDLRRIARAYMRRERPDHTLQTTALVNEAYLRLFQGQPFRWEDRKHVFCTMARTMRRVLIDHARLQHAGKHGGELRKVSLDEGIAFSQQTLPELFAVDEALEKLSKVHPRPGQVVDLRFFGGLTVEEAAAILEVSPKTVKLDWRFAKTWLQREMKEIK